MSLRNLIQENKYSEANAAVYDTSDVDLFVGPGMVLYAGARWLGHWAGVWPGEDSLIRSLIYHNLVDDS